MPLLLQLQIPTHFQHWPRTGLMTRCHTGAHRRDWPGRQRPATAAARRTCVTCRRGGLRAALWFPAVDLAAPRCLRPYVLTNSSPTAGKPAPANDRCVGPLVRRPASHRSAGSARRGGFGLRRTVGGQRFVQTRVDRHEQVKAGHRQDAQDSGGGHRQDQLGLLQRCL
jgi:hypothetical protein